MSYLEENTIQDVIQGFILGQKLEKGGVEYTLYNYKIKSKSAKFWLEGRKLVKSSKFLRIRQMENNIYGLMNEEETAEFSKMCERYGATLIERGMPKIPGGKV